ncbi:MAG TPA: MBOAT family protein [Rhizobiales bacterium]|nr:MBOAT family protein [Hyphomicrobiales bacterium]
MVFTSPTFLYAFLPLFLVAYFAMRGMVARNAVFVAFSLVFYAWGEPVFVGVLLASIVVNWLVGMRVADLPAGRRTAVMALGLAWNLGILAVAKYADFVLESVGTLIGADMPKTGWALPLGVSFFTFHAISYLVDVYRGNAGAERSLLRLTLYITMFPQLVAGPIVRYRTIARQLATRRVTLWRASTGTRIFVIGMAQKVLIANQLGLVADVAFGLGDRLDTGEAWLGLACYSLQIYYDFAGYSNMAIGLGFIVGLALPRNFDLPYTSQSITEFWRRWHISLSRWFRDYLYIPLGGNRRGRLRTYANLAIVFLLCGLWHGASWNFVIWGAWYGVFLIVERAFLLGLLAESPRMLRNAYALAVVMLGWVWFRAETLPGATAYFRALAGGGGNGAVDAELAGLVTGYSGLVFVFAAILALTPGGAWKRLRRASLPAAESGGGAVVRLAANTFWAALLGFSMAGIAGSGYNPFLYFRF